MSTISFQERQNKIDQLEQKINVLSEGTLRDDARSQAGIEDKNSDRLFETLVRIETKVLEQEKLLINTGTSIDQKDEEFLLKLIIDQIQKQNELVTKKIVDNLNIQIQQSQNTIYETMNKFKQEILQEFILRAGFDQGYIQQQAKQLQKHAKESNEQGEKVIRQMNEMKTDFETHLHKNFEQSEKQMLKLIELNNQLKERPEQEQSEKLFEHIYVTKVEICKNFDQKLNEVNSQIQKHNQEIQEQTELLYELSNQIQEQGVGKNDGQIKKILSQIDDMKSELIKLEQYIKQQQIASDDRNDKLDDLLDKVENRNDKIVDLLEKVDERNDKLDDLLETANVK